MEKPRIHADSLERPLIRNETVIEAPVDQRTITRRYTDEAIDFITANQERPFFLYLPHSMPHVPLYVPDDMYDPDPQKAYQQVTAHIDAEVGRIIATIRDLNLAKNTIIIYTSDNGPWLKYRHHGGSGGPLRDGKMSTFEGGHRVPFIAWGPGRIPAGTTSGSLLTTMDLLPTIAAFTNSSLPSDLQIDGHSAASLLQENPTQVVRNEFLYYNKDGTLEGIRQVTGNS